MNLMGFVGNNSVGYVDINGNRIPFWWVVKVLGEFLGSDQNPQNKEDSSELEEFMKGRAQCAEIRARGETAEKRCGCCVIQILKKYKTHYVGWGGDSASYSLLEATYHEEKCDNCDYKGFILDGTPGDHDIIGRKLDW